MQSKSFLVSALGLVDDRGYSVLHHAAAHGAGACISLLCDIASVAHPNLSSAQCRALMDRRTPDKRGLTPLHFPVMNAHVNAARSLLETGYASPSAPDFDGRSCLHMAAFNEDLAMMEVLLENGANPNQADVDGTTPLMEASSGGNINVVMLLLKHGAFVDVKDNEGEEAIFYAVRESKMDVVQALVKFGTDIANCKNEDGESLVDVCVALREYDLADFLKSSFGALAFKDDDNDQSIVDDDDDSMDIDMGM